MLNDRYTLLVRTKKTNTNALQKTTVKIDCVQTNAYLGNEL